MSAPQASHFIGIGKSLGTFYKFNRRHFLMGVVDAVKAWFVQGTEKPHPGKDAADATFSKYLETVDEKQDCISTRWHPLEAFLKKGGTVQDFAAQRAAAVLPYLPDELIEIEYEETDMQQQRAQLNAALARVKWRANERAFPDEDVHTIHELMQAILTQEKKVTLMYRYFEHLHDILEAQKRLATALLQKPADAFELWKEFYDNINYEFMTVMELVREVFSTKERTKEQLRHADEALDLFNKIVHNHRPAAEKLTVEDHKWVFEQRAAKERKAREDAEQMRIHKKRSDALRQILEGKAHPEHPLFNLATAMALRLVDAFEKRRQEAQEDEEQFDEDDDQLDNVHNWLELNGEEVVADELGVMGVDLAGYTSEEVVDNLVAILPTYFPY